MTASRHRPSSWQPGGGANLVKGGPSLSDLRDDRPRLEPVIAYYGLMGEAGFVGRGYLEVGRGSRPFGIHAERRFGPEAIPREAVAGRGEREH